jgi:hypothetical protein
MTCKAGPMQPADDPALRHRELTFVCRDCGATETREEYPYAFAAACGVPIRSKLRPLAN